MEWKITFPGGARVDADVGEFTIRTDQPTSAGGEGSAPSPLNLFLASIGTCAGYYVMRFCQERGLSTDDVSISQRFEADRVTGRLTAIDLSINVPADFPAKYAAALVRSAEKCAVKKYLETPPYVRIHAVSPEPLSL